MRSVLARPDAVFSLLPLKTEAFARLPRAILLTAFFFMTFIAAFFMDFIADDFIIDFFMLVHYSATKIAEGSLTCSLRKKPQSNQTTPKCQYGAQKCKNW
ncbi:unnamed protein product [Durusdinium trenchii]|uniref:Uncharacterized protein n=1 Tax=Durusdinium trenchii TaxID=1381693 RepID=A0ABP0HHA2_9DINO